jgi:hypothetical protein
MPTFSTPASAPPVTAKKTNNRRKKVSDPVPLIEPESKPEPEPEPEPDSPVSQPTFPNMVILKQTEHNYIVKHNHYPVSVSTSGSGSSSSGLMSSNPDCARINPLIQDDLVSPNQIHKGQINKKRGRKPKAGLILNSKGGIYDTTEVPNIILHLKCHLSDLKTNESISSYEYTPAISDVESYTAQSNYLQPSDISTQNNNEHDTDEYESDTPDTENQPISENANCNNNDQIDKPNEPTAATAVATMSVIQSSQQTTVKKAISTDTAIQVINERNQKEIMKKIQRLKYSFHNGETIQTKMNHRPACFWDTCEFDGPMYYIPIMIVNGVFQVNGCYCSPQCAVASLLKEPLDTSTKFERLHLLHLLYGTTSSKGFKPAPNPHYLLDKYYGNLTIQEYRSLLKGSQMIHIVNKPLTHILPELYEDNNDFLVNSKVIPANSLKMKKKYKTMVVQSGAE